jgi:hypothetical protein
LWLRAFLLPSEPILPTACHQLQLLAREKQERIENIEKRRSGEKKDVIT